MILQSWYEGASPGIISSLINSLVSDVPRVLVFTFSVDTCYPAAPQCLLRNEYHQSANRATGYKGLSSREPLEVTKRRGHHDLV